jgi:hypothetical protein
MQPEFNAELPPYQFVNGNGDSDHQDTVNSVAAKGYEVVSMVFDPDATQKDHRVVVLMGRKP